jgi:cob(I)alamin adenosyltransferase
LASLGIDYTMTLRKWDQVKNLLSFMQSELLDFSLQIGLTEICQVCKFTSISDKSIGLTEYRNTEYRKKMNHLTMIIEKQRKYQWKSFVFFKNFTD